MKNVIIIHGCPSDQEDKEYNKHWIPWTVGQLTQKGIDTKAPIMPNPWAPVYEDFKTEFEKSTVNENTVLIGHSCGSTFLVRWLGETKQKVSKLILVAPWCIADQDDIGRIEYYEHKFDEKIKERVGEVVIFTSDDEEEDGKKSAEIFNDVLGGKIINLPNHGHYTIGDMGKAEFPELLDEILKD